MILIVDDKPENLTALKKTLESHDFEVDTALSGEEALKKLLKSNYQLVILDVQMPEMDGFEVAEAMTGVAKTSNLPIIFLSAVNISKEFIKKGYASGGHDYLVKPFDPDILILKIRTFIKLHQQAMELSRMQSILLEEIEQRKAAEIRKDEFISIASHELKTPLTSVKGYTQLAEISILEDDKENALKFIGQAATQLNKLNKLIGELLDISKMEAGQMDFTFKTFRFDHFLYGVIDVFAQSHPQRQIQLKGNCEGSVHADAMRLEQVLLNYLSNALKYSGPEHPICVELKKEEERFLTVKVSDKGIGVPKELHSKIFEKFYRVEQTSYKYQGLGMGLYICAEIIQRHNGAYGVESIEGEGSSFYFSLPSQPEEPSSV